MCELARFLDDLSERYLERHRAKEESFWDTRMGLADRHDELVEAELSLREFLGDPQMLKELRRRRASGIAAPDQDVVLDGWILMFERNQVEDPAAATLQRKIMEQETALRKARTAMELGWRDGEGKLVPASSIELSNHLRSSEDSELRRASFEGLRSIETFALNHGFTDIVRGRNRFARGLGYEDYYDYKVQWAEGFDKRTLFTYLDDLEARTREHAAGEIERLGRQKGENALDPWNFVYHTWGGSLTRERDPYFRFEDALERWVQSFSRLGIGFRKARITLDLVDRKGKYENGFMHGPVPAFRRRGKWQPASINFAANALPDQVGAGLRAAQTLFHEGGHAAHFSNIVTDAPCFSQEFAPMSVALAETQSMFCDSLLNDADWQTRYARSESGEPIPFDLIERQIRATHPFAAQAIRQMLVVCYVEKALYEMSEDELTPGNVLRVIRDVERRVTLLPGGSPRPTLAVPHLLSWEASAYYHGYVLAEMAVYQTREHFRRKYGRLLDNPAIGRDLAEIYWRPGSSRDFRDLVREMTGAPLSGDALVEHVSRPVDTVLREARADVRALEESPEPAHGPVDLDLRLRIIHGLEVVVEEGTPPLEAAVEFREWLRRNWPREAPVTPS